jgi:EmrB/QacA subfamily drug resistance transporter
MTAFSTTTESVPELSSRTKLRILGAILLALFLFALDQTVVGTALPVIVTDLNGNSLYTWVVTIYLLTATISGPIYGRLSDLFGRRPIIIFAISLFLVGSVLCGLSQQMWQLILFRGIQGLGGGAIFPVSLAVVADLYTPAERGKYLGLFGAVFGLSSLLGPAIGGIITDNISWHWVFFVNVPLGLVSLAVIWRLLPAIRRPDAGRNIDYVGAAVFALAITLFLIGLTNKQTGEWTDPAVGGLILAGLAIGVVFLWIESRAADPIVPLSLFRIRNFSVSVAAMFLAAFGFFGAVIFLPRWFQTVAGASATESGYSILPLLFGLIFSATVSGQIVARTGHYKVLMLGSLLLLAAGLFALTHLTADTDRLVLSLWMLITGLGIGPSFAVFTLVVQNSVAPARIGVATGSLTFFQQIGGTIGLTLAGTVLANRLVTEIPAQLVAAGVPKPVIDGFASSGGAGVDLTGTGDLGQRILAAAPAEAKPVIEPLIPNIVQAIHEAFSIAIASTFWVGIAGALLAFVFVLFLQEQPMRATFEIEEPAVAVGGA